MGGSTKGRILKVRMGHEANCSSGMIAGFLLIYGSVAYLLLSVITSVVSALARVTELRAGEQESKRRIVYWITPQVIGLGFTIFLGLVAFWDNAPILTVGALAMSIFLALSTGVGFLLMQRIKHPALIIGVGLLVPLIFVVCLAIFLWMFGATRMWDILASSSHVPLC